MNLACIQAAAVGLFLCAHTTAAWTQDAETMGVHVVSGLWSPQQHADRSYVAYKAVQKHLDQYDFYYQLEVYPKYKLTFSNCQNTPNLKAFLTKFVGKSSSSFLTIKSTIRHRGLNGETEVWSDHPTLLVGHGLADTSGATGNGCFFDQALSARTPFIRISSSTGNHADGFLLAFTVYRASSVQINIVSRIKELFSAMNAAFSFTDLSGARATAYETAATQFQTAFNDAGRIPASNKREVTLSAAGGPQSRFALSMPSIISPTAGYFAFFVNLKASLVLTPSLNVTPDNILINTNLGAPTCSPKPATKMSECLPTAKTFRSHMHDKIEKMPPRFFDTTNPEKRKSTFDTCIRIRTEATENLRLSTLDALLVRWAAVKDGGLMDLLTLAKVDSPEKRKPLEDLAKENARTTSELVKECWNDDDQRKLAQVVLAVTGKPLK